MHVRCLEALLSCSNRHVPSLNLRQPSERAAQALNALHVQLRAAVQQKGRCIPMICLLWLGAIVTP